MKHKDKILIIMGRYLPGYKDGGPVRSIINLTDYLGDEYDFYILAYDRDHGDTEPYPNIKINNWNKVRKSNVYYVSPKGYTFRRIKQLAKDVDLIYVCGCFSNYSIKTLILKRLKKIKNPVVIAAMGLFSPGALQIKSFKKKLFVKIFNFLGMFKNIYWSATSSMEKNDIINIVNTKKDQIYIAEDLPRTVHPERILKNKTKGHIRIVFISRFTPKKNLKQAINILQQVKCNVDFVLYGPDENKAYWEECKKELERLPSNVKWKWEGILNSEKVVVTLKQYEIFLFPTKGENYGHVIQEALSAGCACIISDQTPWQDLEIEGVGYVFPLDSNKPFVDAIEKYAAMDRDEFQKISDRAHEYAIKVSNYKAENTGYRTIFSCRGKKL